MAGPKVWDTQRIDADEFAETDDELVYEGAFREPIVAAGTAHLDRLTWIATRGLVELVVELHPDRHAEVTQRARELIGNP